jgi:hypothetical protein
MKPKERVTAIEPASVRMQDAGNLYGDGLRSFDHMWLDTVEEAVGDRSRWLIDALSERVSRISGVGALR